MGLPPAVPPAIDTAAFCPPESAIASPRTFRDHTTVNKGETAFQTVKRFRLAEQKKNADGKRLYKTYAECRAGLEQAMEEMRRKQMEQVEQQKQAREKSLLGSLE